MANNKDFVINNPINIAGSSIETSATSTQSTTSAFNPDHKQWGYGNRNRTYFDVTAVMTNPSGVTFKPDGTMMFIAFLGDDRIYQYDLSTPWDITTAVPRLGTGDELWVGALNGSPRCIHFAPNGSAIFVINTSGGAKIDRHDLTTPWDLSTASSTISADINVGSRDLTPTAYTFNADGSKMYLTGSETSQVYTYNTSNPFIPIGASYDSSEVLALPNSVASMTTPDSMFLSSDGHYLYVGESQYLYR